MEHKKYEELLQLSFLNEADAAQLNELKLHLAQCASCRDEFEKLRKLDQYLLSKKQQEIPGSLLQDSRNELRQRLIIERNKESIFSRIFGRAYRNIKIRPGYILSGAFSLAAGLIIGFLIFSQPGKEIVTGPSEVINASDFPQNPADIRNIKLSDPDPEDDQIELSFDAVKNVKVKGSLNDPQIRNMLLYVMLNGKNPGARLNSINAINTAAGQNYDEDVKEAIISSVKYDLNPGVRREALKVLKNFPYDNEIKKSYIYVILNDSSSAMRIDAINQLIETGKKNIALDRDEQKIFKDRLANDENSYIRLRAKTVLQEYL